MTDLNVPLVVASGSDYSYRVCSLDMGLQVQGWVEIAARVAGASTLDGVHADGDRAVRSGGTRVSGVGKAALTALARATLELATHLRHTNHHSTFNITSPPHLQR